MKSNLKIATLAVGAILAVAGSAYADQVNVSSPVGSFSASTTQPWVTYSYTSPQLNVFTGVQFGHNQNTAVIQSGVRNISGFAQVGNNVSATVVQRGAIDFSALSQVGRNTSALVFQFGQ